jgi:hypothetical protein
VTTENLREDLTLLVGFMLTSAHGLVTEPQSYGPARLLDTAGRVLETMDEQGLLDDSLKEIKAEIDRERFGPMDDEGFVARLDALALKWTEALAGLF